MAGTTTPEPAPKLGWKATVAGVLFALAVLGAFGASTAIAANGDDADHHEADHEDVDSHDAEG